MIGRENEEELTGLPAAVRNMCQYSIIKHTVIGPNAGPLITRLEGVRELLVILKTHNHEHVDNMIAMVDANIESLKNPIELIVPEDWDFPSG
ncbi:hypothetical protein [Paenibacillus lignilyticus]|uniref:Uncharacterized protein n=1 Tax=Paenibacillus lignilyticus TaxID=1172615 RepID=A0ABS5CL43_9BACL|nr:hypothetical protein [Paenibacillus lignilyticus]MBP3966547.1 hypothetical protein [Paenibacillus lignilyticus]